MIFLQCVCVCVCVCNVVCRWGRLTPSGGRQSSLSQHYSANCSHPRLHICLPLWVAPYAWGRGGQGIEGIIFPSLCLPVCVHPSVSPPVCVSTCIVYVHLYLCRQPLIRDSLSQTKQWRMAAMDSMWWGPFSHVSDHMPSPVTNIPPSSPPSLPSTLLL